jgi:hypothetical protein
MRSLRFIPASLVIAAAVAVSTTSASTTSPRFFGDDPLGREPESQDASRAQTSEIGNLY